ncbi:FAD-dependent oxidoreductase [Tepidimonas charontis]|uniref:D-amino-acid oxidase n=1 Tax=Tepidimonas charontis TaxID=2267262 RepID=A0A554XKN3_9BURK|nr:FAD-dependent oxidoreductase [Tepidimonas charontis]TSE36395.1 tRNA 5-methylaminomethyl-2-thiouridine biosynthesis bifunctional protein MnmC [Tepidimonas charontis]
MSDREPVLILGAGLMGRLLAFSLARRGHSVRVLDAAADAQQAGGAARVAAAMLAPLAESAVTEPNVVAMGRYALPRWRTLCAELAAPVFFQQNGTLILWHRQDAREAQRFEALLRTTVTRLPELPAPQAVDAAGLATLEPAVAGRFAHALYLPEEGQLDNRALLDALLTTLHTLDVTVQWGTNATLDEALRWQRAHPDGWVLDCRGLGARADWPADTNPGAGPLRGVRGEVVRLYAPDVTLQRPTRLLHPRYPIYIAPKPNHLFVIGATEIESDDRSPASVRSTLELLSAAYAVHPGFAEARILELNTECRPTLPDNLPTVRESAPRVLHINGLYRHGFLIAPAVHDAVLEYLSSGATTLATQLGLRFVPYDTKHRLATALS